MGKRLGHAAVVHSRGCIILVIVMTLVVVIMVVQIGKLGVRLSLLDNDTRRFKIHIRATVGDIIGDSHTGRPTVHFHILRPKVGVDGGGTAVGMALDDRPNRRQSVDTITGHGSYIMLAMGAVKTQHLHKAAFLVLQFLELRFQVDILSFKGFRFVDEVGGLLAFLQPALGGGDFVALTPAAASFFVFGRQLE